MRLLIATGIYPPEIGGPATVIKELADALVTAGHEVEVVTYGKPREGVIAISRFGGGFIRYIRFAWTVRNLLTPETIVLATDVFSVGVPVRLALFGKHNRFVLRLGGEWMWEMATEREGLTMTLREFWKQEAWLSKRNMRRMQYEWVLRRAAKIVVTSDLLKEVLSVAFSKIAGRMVTVVNTADGRVTNFEPRIVSLALRPHDPLRLLYVGRFVRVKSVSFLCFVLKRLVDSKISVACCFAGDGPEIDACRKILEGMPGMDFLGKVAQEKLPDLFARADLLVLPSLSDFCPNAVVEALVAGLPCLITTEHGLPRPLRGVIEIPPQDEKAWREAISLLRNQEAYRKLASAVHPLDRSSFLSFVEALDLGF